MIFAVMDVATALNINEVMYDAPGSDNNKEYIEIFSEDFVNLTDWIVSDNSSNDTLELLQFFNSSFALITEEGFNYSGINASIYSAGATIGNNLGNTEDEIKLFDLNKTLIAYFYYNSLMGADGNGNSLSLINDSWQEALSTPGRANERIEENESENRTRGLKLTAYLDDLLFTNIEYTSLFKIENLDYPEIKNISVNLSYTITKNNSLIKNETREITGINSYKTANTGLFSSNETGNFTLCGEITNSSDCKDFEVIETSTISCNITINTTTEKLIYEGKISFWFKLNNKTFPFEIEYWIDDLFSETAKKSHTTKNTNKKSWTPKIKEIDRVFLIKARLNAFCNNSGKTYAEKMVIVLNKETGEEQKERRSYINITSVSNASFGKTATVKIKAYKGDTNKRVVEFWAEGSGKISEVTKAYLNKKFSYYELAVPIFIKPNCDRKKKNSSYTLVVKGLGLRKEQSFDVNGNDDSLCKAVKENKTCKEQIKYVEVPVETAQSRNNMEYPLRNITSYTAYESTTKKANNTALYFIIGLLAFTCILLVWRR